MNMLVLWFYYYYMIIRHCNFKNTSLQPTYHFLISYNCLNVNILSEFPNIITILSEHNNGNPEDNSTKFNIIWQPLNIILCDHFKDNSCNSYNFTAHNFWNLVFLSSFLTGSMSWSQLTGYCCIIFIFPYHAELIFPDHH